MPDCFKRLFIVELETVIIFSVQLDMPESRCFHNSAFYVLWYRFSVIKQVTYGALIQPVTVIWTLRGSWEAIEQ